MSNFLPIVVANLKANKTWEEVSFWLDEVGKKAQSFSGTIVFCPSFPFLASASQKMKSANFKIELGAQDISEFEQGPYTGEVAASQVSNICRYVIIGHSERRQNFGEDQEMLAKKVKRAKAAQIEPIFCVQGAESKIPEGAKIVAYEPTFAIGSGNPDSPQNIETVSKKIKERGEYTIIYGGSASGQNVKLFIRKGIVDGVLVGASNSLDPRKFCEVLANARFD